MFSFLGFTQLFQLAKFLESPKQNFKATSCSCQPPSQFQQHPHAYIRKMKLIKTLLNNISVPKKEKNSTNNRKDPPPKENRLSRGRKDVRSLCATRLFCMSNFSCGSLRMFREANWDIHLMPLRHLAQKQVSVGFVSPNSGLPSPTPVPFLKENSFNGFSASFFS